MANTNSCRSDFQDNRERLLDAAREIKEVPWRQMVDERARRVGDEGVVTNCMADERVSRSENAP